MDQFPQIIIYLVNHPNGSTIGVHTIRANENRAQPTDSAKEWIRDRGRAPIGLVAFGGNRLSQRTDFLSEGAVFPLARMGTPRAVEAPPDPAGAHAASERTHKARGASASVGVGGAGAA